MIVGMGVQECNTPKSTCSQEPTIEDLDEGILTRIFEYVFGEPFHAWDSVFGRRFEDNARMEPTCIDGFAHGLVLPQVGLQGFASFACGPATLWHKVGTQCDRLALYSC